MKKDTVLKQYPAEHIWKRAAFLLYHADMLLYRERLAIGDIACSLTPSNESMDIINAAFIRNMKLIKGVNLTETSGRSEPAKPLRPQAPASH